MATAQMIFYLLGAVFVGVVGWSAGWINGYKMGFLTGKQDILGRIEKATGRQVEEGGVPRELPESEHV